MVLLKRISMEMIFNQEVILLGYENLIQSCHHLFHNHHSYLQLFL